MNITHLHEELSKASLLGLVRDSINIISRHNRLQGSVGLWEAVRDVEDILKGMGLPAKTVRIDEGSARGFVKTPISWTPLEASLKIKVGDKVIANYSLNDHPTLLAAHSPGGEGCAELRVCGEKPCEGEAILVTGYLYDIYMNSDAKLILYYTKDRYHDAIPYTGLFLEPGDKFHGVVMNIPYKLALRIMSIKIENPRRRIEVCWKAKIRRHRMGLPVLISCKGEDPGVLFISHICHPKPGAHDNASGSAANIHVAYLLDAVRYNGSYCNVWVPEYTGTVFLDEILPWKPLAVVNLDMVGSRQYITGSTLSLIIPPRVFDSYISATSWISLVKIFDKNKSFNGIGTPGIRYSVTPYTMGSDHDVFIGWGIDSVMFNEWPSKYYHTERDTTETLDPENIVETSIASSMAAIITIREKTKLEYFKKLFRSYMTTWYKMQALKNGFSISYLSRNLIKSPVITMDKAYETKLLESPIFSRTIYKVLGREFFNRIRRIKGAYTYLGLYAPLHDKIGLNNHIKHYQAELLIRWSRREEKTIREAWEIIKSQLSL